MDPYGAPPMDPYGAPPMQSYGGGPQREPPAVAEMMNPGQSAPDGFVPFG
jgi:hypothetical protein